jgi:hypothetical protein
LARVAGRASDTCSVVARMSPTSTSSKCCAGFSTGSCRVAAAGWPEAVSPLWAYELSAPSIEYAIGTLLRGDWKRVCTFRAPYWRSNTGTNKPLISSAFCGDIPGYGALALSSLGQQYGIEILATDTTPRSIPLTGIAGVWAFPARGTNKAHMYFFPNAAAAGGPTFGPTVVSGATTTSSGGWYFDSGTNNPIGPAFHDGTAWRPTLHANAVANGAVAAGNYGSILGAWQFDHMQQVTFDSGKNIVTSTTTGTKICTGTTQLVGFWNVAPVAQPSAFTQTYSTATKTHSNPTATSVATAASTNIAPFGYTTTAQADAIVTAINALIVDVANIKGVLNAVIDDGQAVGLLA